jgi:hypothetical protein
MIVGKLEEINFKRKKDHDTGGCTHPPGGGPATVSARLALKVMEDVYGKD